MIKRLILLAVILVISCMILSASAQDTVTNKKGKIEIGMGLNFFGPKLQMADLLVEYGFNDVSNSWLSSLGSSTANPHYSMAGFTGLISYSYRIAPRSQLGILMNYSNLTEVFGYSNTSGYLFVKFSNVSLVPMYKFKLKENGEFQTGPALMINRGNKSSGGSGENENYTKFSIGLLAGLSVKIWDSRVTNGKIGANYLLTYKNNIGPYTSSSFGNDKAIPESKISFSHLNIIFTLGFKN